MDNCTRLIIAQSTLNVKQRVRLQLEINNCITMIFGMQKRVTIKKLMRINQIITDIINCTLKHHMYDTLLTSLENARKTYADKPCTRGRYNAVNRLVAKRKIRGKAAMYTLLCGAGKHMKYQLAEKRCFTIVAKYL